MKAQAAAPLRTGLSLFKLHALEYGEAKETPTTLRRLADLLSKLAVAAQAQASEQERLDSPIEDGQRPDLQQGPPDKTKKALQECAESTEALLERRMKDMSPRHSQAELYEGKALASMMAFKRPDIPDVAGNQQNVDIQSPGQAATADLPQGRDQAAELLSPPTKKQRVHKEFDISAYHQRYIGLEVLYVGWQYMGSTYQPKEENTVEGKLLEALKRSRLIAEDATLESINLSRSGRTDRGVSGLGQVVALNVRSKGKISQPLPSPEEELDFCQSLNKGLPQDIRVLGWTDLSPDFSARFSAQYREYRYFIPHNKGDMDLVKMQQAANAFLGQHDFRNFCKVDAEHIKHCVRCILDFRIEEYPGMTIDGKGIAQIHIRGSAFLWHQVRCMVAILILVGQRHEDPSIVRQMLDTDTFGNKPQYNLADDEPLLFYSCGYAGLNFQRSKESAFGNFEAIDRLLSQHIARVALLQTMAVKLMGQQHLSVDSTGGIVPWRKLRKHILLHKRGREASLEDKFARFGKAMLHPSFVKFQGSRADDVASQEQSHA